MAHNTSVPSGEKEMAVDPPTRVNVSVSTCSVGDVGADVGVGIVVDDGREVGVVVGPVDVVTHAVDVVGPLDVDVGSDGDVVVDEDGVVVPSGSARVGTGIGADAAKSAAGAGSMISLSTTATPVHATPIAAPLPASQSSTNPIVLMSPVSPVGGATT